MTFCVSDATDESNLATITIRYAHVVGDLDGDRDTDLADFRAFQLCFGGSDSPPASTCQTQGEPDLDGDGDVELGDFQLFVENLTDPG